MPISFPVSLDSLSNPAAADPRIGHAEQHALANDAIEVIEAVIGTDSSPGLARLRGVAGGQTLVGGTLAGETLALQSTGHATKGKILLGVSAAYDELTNRLGIGLTSPLAKLHAMAISEQLRLGYDSTNYLSVNVASNGFVTLSPTGGNVTIQGTTATDGPTLGAELLTTAGWTVPSGWTESPDDVFAHANGGGTAALSHSASITSAAKYQVSWTVSGRTAGSFTVSIGGQSLASNTDTGTFGPTATATTGLTITPTNDFDGAIAALSVKQITAVSTAALSLKSSTATYVWEARAIAQTTVAVGFGALRYNTTGIRNSAFGYFALSQNTTGSNNTSFGCTAMQNCTVGNQNTGLGFGACLAITNGSNNTGVGYGALYNITGGFYNVGLGMYAGRMQADGATSLVNALYSTYLGYSSRGFSDADSYSIVIGANAVGLGANTTVLGTINQTTAATIYGTCTHSLTDATNNAPVTVESLIKNVTGAGVGAAGLGPRLVFGAESSTTADTTQADIAATWTDATHATRKTRLAFSAWDFAAAREGLRIEADGAAPRLGFYGATAVVKPAALTATAPAAPAGGTGTAAGGWDTAANRDLAIATINNLKTRVDELEAKLRALGLLT
mgnify:CR=1 FL=1